MGGRGGTNYGGGGGGGEANFAQMDGSEKQVVWANDIKKEAINNIENYDYGENDKSRILNEFGKSMTYGGVTVTQINGMLYYAPKKELEKLKKEVINKIKENKSAKDIIDKRHDLKQNLMAYKHFEKNYLAKNRDDKGKRQELRDAFIKNQEKNRNIFNDAYRAKNPSYFIDPSDDHIFAQIIQRPPANNRNEIFTF